MNFATYLTLFTLFMTSRAQNNGTKYLKHYLNYNVSVVRTENYIDLNRRQFAEYILEFERQIDTYKQHYNDRLDLLNLQLELLVDVLLKTDERLNPLEVLSDISKDCVSKYRSKIPTIATTKLAIQGCINTATGQLNALVANPETTKRNLQAYYTNTFEKELKNCETRFPALDANYTVCLTTVVATTKITTVNHQKAFETQIDASFCSGKANVKKALECGFVNHNRTVALNTEANLMIDKCLQGLDDCERCSQSHFCDSVYYMPQYQVDYNNATMINPFYGRNATSDCLMLEIY